MRSLRGGHLLIQTPGAVAFDNGQTAAVVGALGAAHVELDPVDAMRAAQRFASENSPVPDVPREPLVRHHA